MPYSKRKNVEKARVFNNLKRNFPEQPREAESIAVGENCIQELGCRKATTKQMILQSIMTFQLFLEKHAKTEEATYKTGNLKGVVCTLIA